MDLVNFLILITKRKGENEELIVQLKLSFFRGKYDGIEDIGLNQDSFQLLVFIYNYKREIKMSMKFIHIKREEDPIHLLIFSC